MRKKCFKYLFLFIFVFLGFHKDVQALTGIVNVNDSLTLRDGPTTTGGIITKFYNATELTILNTNAGSGNGCSGNWYKVSYGGYTGYSCGDYIVLKQENTSIYQGEDDSYSKSNYDQAPSKDGTIMCYEDTGALSLRSSANGSKTGIKVNCGDEVSILETVDKPNTTCPYWYKIHNGQNSGYVCGYYVNTTKLSSTAQNYYNNKTNGDTIASYKQILTKNGFPESYHSYLLELHARHPNWIFVAEKLNMNFGDAVVGESGNGASLLQKAAPFDEGYFSLDSNTYNVLTDTFSGYSSEPGYYNASREAIAYYMDPRNYLNEKYIFAFETLGYSSNQNSNVVSSILSGQSFWPSVYSYYNKSGAIQDSLGNVNSDIVQASSKVGISAVHVASRIKQEISGLSTSDSRIGGSFTYNGNNFSNYYNFFNIKSRCSNCSSIYSGYAYEQGWNTPYKGIYGGANFMYNGYISINQDTIYYEKFDVSTTNGHYTHQYMQNLAAPVQEGGTKYNSYVSSLNSYLNTAITFVIPVYEDMPSYAVTAPKVGNPNNYLKDLTVDGVSVSNFSYNTYNYNVYLSSNTTLVRLGASVINGNTQVSGLGEIQITSDYQTNSVVVTAQNGKIRTYVINFIREESNSTTVGDAMNHSGFKYNNNYLFGIQVGTNVSNLIGNIRDFNHSVGVTIKATNGTVKTNDIFKTGDQIIISGNDGVKTYTAIIYGDANGDGRITAVDYVNVKNYIMGGSNLTGSYLQAADVNKDGKVTAVDYVQIKNSIMGNSSITQ